MEHRVRGILRYLGRALDGKTGPFLHGGPVDVLFSVLRVWWSASRYTRVIATGTGELTSKAIHDIGSSLGISVRLTSSHVSFSSSKAMVKMAPGGVHVPTIKWWMVILAGCWSTTEATGGRRLMSEAALNGSIKG